MPNAVLFQPTLAFYKLLHLCARAADSKRGPCALERRAVRLHHQVSICSLLPERCAREKRHVCCLVQAGCAASGIWRSSSPLRLQIPGSALFVIWGEDVSSTPMHAKENRCCACLPSFLKRRLSGCRQFTQPSCSCASCSRTYRCPSSSSSHYCCFASVRYHCTPCHSCTC